MTVLVTGAGGFIGGHLVKALLDEGHEVRAVDIRPTGEWKQVHKAAQNISGRDLSEYWTCRQVTRNCHTIYHLAADSGGMGYITFHQADCMQNVLADTQMARAAVAEGSRIYYASSSCAYPLHIQEDVNTPPVKEDDLENNPFNPEKGYGWEKLFSEMVYQAYGQDYGLDYRIGRFFSVYGTHGWYKGGREKAPTALSRKIATAKLTGARSIEVWGDGRQRRTFTYVDDAINAVLAITASECTDPLNVGAPKASSIDELVDVIEEIADYKVEREYNLDMPRGVGGRPSDDTKIRNAVGWKPQVRFRDGIERTYAWVYDQVKAELKLLTMSAEMLPLSFSRDSLSGVISVLLPSRQRRNMLLDSVASLRDMAADSSSVEILVAHDPDDTETPEAAREAGADVIWQAPERFGYARLGCYYAELIGRSGGEWLMPTWGDDGRMKTPGWDDIIRAQRAGSVIWVNGNIPGFTCFPVVHRNVLETVGRFFPLPGVDTWFQEIGEVSRIMVSPQPPIYVFQDRFDLTGNNGDDLHREARAALPETFNEYYTEPYALLRQEDVRKLRSLAQRRLGVRGHSER